MATAELPKVKAIAPWYGASRMIAEHVGKATDGYPFCAVPFMGGGCELLHIKSRTLLCADLHKHVVNLASVMADRELGPKLYRRLRRVPHSDLILQEAQETCRSFERASSAGTTFLPWRATDDDRLRWATAYFIACWSSRNGFAGKKPEFETGFSVRYDAGGGDSAVRLRNATRSIVALRRFLARATFQCRDAFDLLDDIGDRDDTVIYCDPPWPKDGGDYAHAFTTDQQKKLARKLEGYRKARVVLRYGDHPLIRELYPERKWRWQAIEGRTSGNNKKAEVLIVNRSSLNEQEGARLF
jgi:DNA adenine methylase